MYAVKNLSTGQFYTGQKKQKWGTRCEAKWTDKATAKAIVGGLRNSPTLRLQTLRVTSIEE